MFELSAKKKPNQLRLSFMIKTAETTLTSGVQTYIASARNVSVNSSFNATVDLDKVFTI